MKKVLLATALFTSFATAAYAADMPSPEEAFKFMTEQMEKNIADMDTDGDKAISVEEYTKATNDKASTFDKDGTAGLSQEEYKAFALAQLDEAAAANPAMASQMEQMKSMMDAGLAMIMQQFDADKDGNLNMEELGPVNASGFSMTDFNQDGKIDMTDLEVIKTQMGM